MKYNNLYNQDTTNVHQVNKLTHGLLDGKPWFVFALLVVCINLSLLYIIEVNDTWCVLLQVPKPVETYYCLTATQCGFYLSHLSQETPPGPIHVLV